MASSRQRRARWSVVVAAVAMASATAAAQVPSKVSYQGRLLKADGTPSSGAVTMGFALFASETGGAPVWSETQTIGVSDGYYSLFLGDVTPLQPSMLNGAEMYLELSVNGTALSPRQRFASVPYAMNCDTARSLRAGLVNTGGVQVNGTTVIDATGKLVPSALPAHVHAAADVTSGVFDAARIPSGTDATKLPLAGGTMTGVLKLGSSVPLQLGAYPADPVGLNASNAGTTWFNATTGTIRYWNGATARDVGSANTAQPASASTAGYLTSADWATFNGKQPAGNYLTALTGDVTAAGPGSASATVSRLGGVPLSGSPGMAGQVLRFNGMSWAPAVLVTGDVVGAQSVALPVNSVWVGGATGVSSARPLSTDFSTAGAALELSTTGVAAGTYAKLQVDAKGRVLAGSSLLEADVPALSAGKVTSGVFAAARIPSGTDSTKLPLTGGTMSGAINMGGQGIVNAAAPVGEADVANKAYVDAALGGGGGGGACYYTSSGGGIPCLAGYVKAPGVYSPYSGGAHSICCPATSSGVSTFGSFVVTAATFDGNLGGLAGANAKCLADLTANNWLGKSNYVLTASNVKAFLCDSSTCNNLRPNKTYAFAFSGNVDVGGATFSTDAYGRGPGDTFTAWNQTAYFGTGNPGYWTGRAPGFQDAWSVGSAPYTCGNWSTALSGVGTLGVSGFTSTERWSLGMYAFCGNTYRLICIVD